MLKRLFRLLVLLAPALAAAGENDAPRWSFELKGGAMSSAMEDWADYYGNDRLPRYGLGAAYKIWRPLEFGFELAYLRDSGQGFAPGHGVSAGTVRYQLFPVHFTVTLRGVLHEDQWLVPYVGAAIGRSAYRVSIVGQERVSGSTGSSQYRAGVQLLLDRFDRRSAYELQRSGGIRNTYLFVEYQKSEAEIAGSDLGGEAWQGGLLFEF